MSKIMPTFLLAWICLSLVGYFLYVDTVESDLHARSKEATFTAGFEWLSISQQGRDITLHGSAPDEGALNDAVNIVKNVYGVRVVKSDQMSKELPDQALLVVEGNDRDNDGVIDTLDVFPDNANEQLDHDADGVGDNGDTDDDNEGIKDHLDAFPYLHADVSDMDGDGVSDSQDIYPNDISRWSDEQIETSSIDKNQSSNNPCSIDIGRITSHTMIYFETSSSIVDSEGFELLRKLGGLLNDCPFYYVNVIGHTDLRGSLLINQQLSEQRAANVEAQLIDFGVNHQRIKTSGVAASSPTTDNMTIDGLAGNRRVEIALTQ